MNVLCARCGEPIAREGRISRVEGNDAGPDIRVFRVSSRWYFAGGGYWQLGTRVRRRNRLPHNPPPPHARRGSSFESRGWETAWVDGKPHFCIRPPARFKCPEPGCGHIDDYG